MKKSLYKKSVNLIILNIFSIIFVVIGIFLYLFPPEFVSYPDKKVGGILIIIFGVSNLIFINLFGRSKLVQAHKPGFFYIIESLIIVSFISCILGFMGLFSILLWYDTFTHFLVPMLATIFAYLIYCAFKSDYKFNFGTILVFSLAMIGVIFLWEFLEFVKEQYSDYDLWLTNGDPDDFRDDIIAGFIGIAWGTIISGFIMKPLLKNLKN